MASSPIHALDGCATNPALARSLGILNPYEWQGEEPPPREWLLEGWLPWRKVTYFTGPGSAGKSLLAQQLCTAAATSRPFMGMAPRRAKALYVTCEDDGDELRRRQRAICQALGITEAETEDRLWLASWVGKAGNELAVFEKPEIDPEFSKLSPMTRETGRYRNLREAAVERGVEFVVLDNVAHLFIGDENNRAQVAGFMSLLEKLAQTIGCVLLIGHPNKAGAQWSGSTAWENQVRSRLYMEVPRDGDGNEPDRDARVLSVGKANYGERGAELRFRWHRGAFIADDDLRDDERAELSRVIQGNADQDTFVRCLRERTRQLRAVSEKRSPSYAPSVFAAMPEAKGTPQKRLEKAMDALFRLGKIERAELWKGPDRKAVYGLRETAGNGAVNTCG
jgi:RecA-family ATPase